EEGEEFFRYLVEPMEVFEDEKQRPAPARADEEFAQGLERLGLDRLGTRQGRRAARILDTEEVQQQYAVLIGIQPDLSQRRAQLSGRDLGVIGLDDPADAAQQIEDEEIRDHRAVGEAPPLDPAHRTSEALAELGKEP